MLKASSLKSKALVFINRGHGLQAKTLEGQHRSIVFTNDQNIMLRDTLIKRGCLYASKTEHFLSIGNPEHG